jgi:hypothetical protein
MRNPSLHQPCKPAPEDRATPQPRAILTARPTVRLRPAAGQGAASQSTGDSMITTFHNQ